MAGQLSQLGTLTVKEGSQTTAFPVRSADFGVSRYTDGNEIYFSVEAGQAESERSSSKGFGREPRLYLEVFRDDLDVTEFAGLNLSVDTLFELSPPYSKAYLYWYDDYDEPELLDDCSIRIGEEQEHGVYPVHWQATLDIDDDTKPGSQITIDVSARFALKRVKEIPCSYRYATRRPFDRWMFILLPVCGIGGYIAAKYIDRLSGWGGVLIGLFVATYLARAIDYRWQRRVHELKFGVQGTKMSSPFSTALPRDQLVQRQCPKSSAAGETPQLGTLTVTQHSEATAFPVHSADFGVNQFADKYEIYFIVEAGEAIAGPPLSDKGPLEPRMNAHVFEDTLDVSGFAGLKLSITDPLKQPPGIRSCASFHYYAFYCEPERLGPSTIEIGDEAGDGVYPIRWQSTLGESYEIEVKADFKLNETRKLPCS